MNNDRLNYLFYIFCFLWFFLLNSILKSYGSETLATSVNYLLYVVLVGRLLWAFTYESKYFGSLETQKFYQRFSLVAFVFVLYAFLQILINPELSKFVYFRKNYSVVIPSVSLALFFGIHSSRNLLPAATSFRNLFYVMALVILYSEFLGTGGSPSEMGEDMRTGGLFNQANNYGYFLVLFILLCVVDLMGLVQINRSKAISGLALAGSLVVLLKTGSYGAIFLSFGGFLYFIFNYLKRADSFRIVALVVVGVGIVVAMERTTRSLNSDRVNALRTLIVGDGASDIVQQSTFDVRLALMREGINTSVENPILGRGLEGRYVDVLGKRAPVHNVLVVEFLKGGIIGFGIIATLYFFIWKMAGRLHYKKWRITVRGLALYIVLIDINLTHPSYLSMGSGVIALALMSSVVFEDNHLRAQKRWTTKVASINRVKLYE